MKKKYSNWSQLLSDMKIDIDKYRLHSAYNKCAPHKEIKMQASDHGYSYEVNVCSCGALCQRNEDSHYQGDLPHPKDLLDYAKKEGFSDSAIDLVTATLNIAMATSNHWAYDNLESETKELLGNKKILTNLYEKFHNAKVAHIYYATINKDPVAYSDAISTPGYAIRAAIEYPSIFGGPDVRSAACIDAGTAATWAAKIDHKETPESRAAQRTYDNLYNYIRTFKWADSPVDKMVWPAPLSESECRLFAKKRTKESAITRAMFNRRPSKKDSKILRNSTRYFVDYCMYGLGEAFREDGEVVHPWSSSWDRSVYQWTFMLNEKEGIKIADDALQLWQDMTNREDGAPQTAEEILAMKYSAARTQYAMAYILGNRDFRGDLFKLACKNQACLRTVLLVYKNLLIVNETRANRGMPQIPMKVSGDFISTALEQDNGAFRGYYY